MGQSATRGVHGKGELVHHGNDSSDSSSFAEFCSSFCLFFFLGGSDSSPALPPVMGKPAKLLYGTSCTRETEGNFYMSTVVRNRFRLAILILVDADVDT